MVTTGFQKPTDRNRKSSATAEPQHKSDYQVAAPRLKHEEKVFFITGGGR